MARRSGGKPPDLSLKSRLLDIAISQSAQKDFTAARSSARIRARSVAIKPLIHDGSIGNQGGVCAGGVGVGETLHGSFGTPKERPRSECVLGLPNGGRRPAGAQVAVGSGVLDGVFEAIG
jgi:hypothetical protein